MVRIPIILLASALAPASLAAQTVSPPVAWEDTPVVHLNLPGAAVMAGAVQAPMTMAPPAPALAPPPAPTMQRPMPPMAARESAAPPPGPGAVHGQRLARGDRVGRFWSGPQVEVRNYGRYGLYPPAEGNRWIRYYDDALLIDSGGYVRDGRQGLDWDQYGEPWGSEGGIPVYVGNGDFGPDSSDYAYVDQSQGPPPPMPMPQREAMAPPPWAEAPPSPAYVERRVEMRPSCYRQRRVVVAPPVHPAVFNGDYPPGTVITETVTTTPPRVITHTYYVQEVVGRRYVARSKRVRRAPPPLRYGERG